MFAHNNTKALVLTLLIVMGTTMSSGAGAGKVTPESLAFIKAPNPVQETVLGTYISGV